MVIFVAQAAGELKGQPFPPVTVGVWGLLGGIGSLAIWTQWVGLAERLTGQPRRAGERWLLPAHLLLVSGLLVILLNRLPPSWLGRLLQALSPFAFPADVLVTSSAVRLVVGLYTLGFLVVSTTALQVSLLLRWAWQFPRWEQLPERELLFLLFRGTLLVYLVGALWLFAAQSVTSDEPHYLLIAHSLARDGDLVVGDDYREREYHHFYPSDLLRRTWGWELTLDWHETFGRNGRLYAIHNVGLPVLILPFYLLAGRFGPALLMVLLTALTATIIGKLCLYLIPERRAALMGTLALAVLSPLFYYSSQIMTEPVAALVVVYIATAVALQIPKGRETKDGGWEARGAKPNFTTSSPGRRPFAPEQQGAIVSRLAWAGGIALLPWLHVKFTLLAGILAGGLVWQGSGRRIRWLPVAALGLSLAALSGFSFAVYGDFRLVAAYRMAQGKYPTLFSGNPLRGGLGMLFDQQDGLFLAAPLLLLALPGFVRGWHLRPRATRWLLLVIGMQFAAFTTCAVWGSGYGPPGRQLLPVLGLLAPFVGWGGQMCWEAGWGRLGRALAGLNGLLVWAFTVVPRFRYPLPEPDLMGGWQPLLGLLRRYVGWPVEYVFPSFWYPTPVTYVVGTLYLLGGLSLAYVFVQRHKG
ncbi:MAG TPA: hypothetical protein EYP85_08085 [Armatimonadetes bacterium]|nr:hypothetical protein [Armatimonadota bacterium]